MCRKTRDAGRSQLTVERLSPKLQASDIGQAIEARPHRSHASNYLTENASITATPASTGQSNDNGGHWRDVYIDLLYMPSFSMPIDDVHSSRGISVLIISCYV